VKARLEPRVERGAGYPKRADVATARGCPPGARGAVKSEVLVPELGRRRDPRDPHRQPGRQPLVPVRRCDCGGCRPCRCARHARETARYGYRFAQVFAPSALDTVCLEPMMAPVAALSTGDELPLLQPGERASAVFRVRVT